MQLYSNTEISMNFKNTLVCGALLLIGGQPALCATDMALYPTGPSQDASFVRFVNGTPQAIEVSAVGSKFKTSLPPDRPATNFLAVAANKEIKGQLLGASAAASAISLTVKPGQFISVVAVLQGAGLTPVLFREQPDDFNALKASLSLYNVDADCAMAGLTVAGKPTSLFEKIAVNTLARRSINPVKLAVQLTCAGKPAGSAVDLGTLQSGRRYTVLAIPGQQQRRLIVLEDATD